MIVKLNWKFSTVFPTVDINFAIKAEGRTWDGRGFIIKPKQLVLAGVPEWWVNRYTNPEGDTEVVHQAVDVV